MSASQVVAAVAWVSVLAAPWAAWATATPFRSPWFVAVVATAVLIGLVSGMHHQGQVAIRRRDALAAVERQMARLDSQMEHRALAMERELAALKALRQTVPEPDATRPNARGPFIRRVEPDDRKRGE